jgi:hypothetical protein
MHRLASAAIALTVVMGTLVSAVPVARIPVEEAGGSQPAESHTSRQFMFQVIGLRTPNQGGHTLNLFFHYRYNGGIRDHEIPDYVKLRDQAVEYLNAADLSANPYWEVLNHRLCAQLKSGYPLEAISCLMQVVGTENPPPHRPSGYRASIETIGDIESLVIPGPATTANP